MTAREWARGPAPMRAARTPTGGQMSEHTVCLGWHWRPYRYTRTAVDVDGAPVTAFPGWLGDLGRTSRCASPDWRNNTPGWTGAASTISK